jgi:hypothetical protein
VPDTILVISAFARTELGTRRARLCPFRDLDQVAELYGPEINLDIEILKVGFDSATAEVGPRSGIIKVKGDLSHRSLRSP